MAVCSRMKAGVVIATLTLLSWSDGHSQGRAQVLQDVLPVVVAGDLPVYPAELINFHVMGTVRARVRTDGKRASDVEGLSGPPLLVEAVRRNVLTWQFVEHEPTSFETTFTYQIREPGDCGPGNSVMTLRLPAEVTVTTPNALRCDPTSSRSVR